jgi:hypothetical protein
MPFVSGIFLLLASKTVTLNAAGSPSASERSIAFGSPPRRYPEQGDRMVGTAQPTNYPVVHIFLAFPFGCRSGQALASPWLRSELALARGSALVAAEGRAGLIYGSPSPLSAHIWMGES